MAIDPLSITLTEALKYFLIHPVLHKLPSPLAQILNRKAIGPPVQQALRAALLLAATDVYDNWRSDYFAGLGAGERARIAAGLDQDANDAHACHGYFCSQIDNILASQWFPKDTEAIARLMQASGPVTEGALRQQQEKIQGVFWHAVEPYTLRGPSSLQQRYRQELLPRLSERLRELFVSSVEFRNEQELDHSMRVEAGQARIAVQQALLVDAIRELQQNGVSLKGEDREQLKQIIKDGFERYWDLWSSRGTELVGRLNQLLEWQRNVAQIEIRADGVTIHGGIYASGGSVIGPQTVLGPVIHGNVIIVDPKLASTIEMLRKLVPESDLDHLLNALATFAELHAVINEWEKAHMLLQTILTMLSGFSSLVQLFLRGKSHDAQDLKIQWRHCQVQIRNLVQFAKTAEYIDVRSIEEGSVSEGESWLMEIVSAQQRIDAALQNYEPHNIVTFFDRVQELVTICESTLYLIGEERRQAVDRLYSLSNNLLRRIAK